ncbi:MAG: acyltransferase, partial [Rickettsiales bacterium]|nr:acyltransferase [Rickettsiales bacterium]
MNGNSSSGLIRPDYRPDIDGLRAFSLCLIVGYHAFPASFPGGFAGVDVFFVISGFLISTLLFENLERGVFRFWLFYARRIRRLFPALLLVLTACMGFGWFGLLADEYAHLGKHVAAGAGFSANLALWYEAGYFDISSQTKPLLHLWSLGVEEQFYLVWPLLLWGVWRARLNALLVMAVLALASFGLAVASHNNTAVFYSPIMRFWELLAGSLLAWCMLYRRECLPKGVAHVLSFFGMGLLVCCIWAIGWQRVCGGVAVLGAVLMIAAGPTAWVNRAVLSARGMVWLGLISYPLYLWHWPMLTFARIIEGATPGWNIRFSLVVLSAVLAWLTYRFVERPVRQGRVSVAWLVALMAATGLSGYVVYRFEGLPQRMLLQ